MTYSKHRYLRKMVHYPDDANKKSIDKESRRAKVSPPSILARVSRHRQYE